jgi:Protein of unknown function (DUF3160)
MLIYRACFIAVTLAFLAMMSIPAKAATVSSSEDITRQTGMFELYQENRVKGIGNFITTDFLMTSYNLLVEGVSADLEERELLPLFHELITSLQKHLLTFPEDRAGRATALAQVSVIRGLLEPEAVPPGVVAAAVKRELSFINAHAGVEKSSVTSVSEDFSQYVPRGRYTANEQLKRYFRASLYSGRCGFALRDSAATGVTPAMADDQTSAALLLSRIIADNDDVSRRYTRLNQVLTLLAGDADDLSPDELLSFAGMNEDPSVPLATVRLRVATAVKAAHRLPRIVGGIVNPQNLEAGVSLAEATLSFRLLGQRYTPDSAAIQLLVFDKVTDYHGKSAPFTLSLVDGRKVRGFPTALDLLGALGSATARRLVIDGGDADYEGYDKRFKDATGPLRHAAHNPRSLADMNLRLVSRLIHSEGKDALNTALGVWVANRHALILQAKQSYTIAPKSIRVEPPVPARSMARLETAPELYGDVIENLYFLNSLMENPALRERVNRYVSLLRKVREIGYRQDEGEATPQDRDLLNNLDVRLKGILGRTDRPLVADIHTNPGSGQVLEEGIGYPRSVNIDGLRGGRYICHEFKQPLDQRLTDDAWFKLLAAQEQPRSLTDIIAGLPSAQSKGEQHEKAHQP